MLGALVLISLGPLCGADAGDHWSFRPLPSHVELPASPDGETPASRIDAFVDARLREAGIPPAARASRETLVRRLTLDLTGLPPAPEAVARFLADDRPGAWERLVDRVLASPRFGERWARPWLDLARYAEDQAHIVGNNISLCYPNAWLYRDWVIEALNRDVPYDRFLRLQLAADLMGGEASDEDTAALGFLGLGPKYYNRGNPVVKAEEWSDRVDVVTRGLLGLTVACARCHDHKHDPIPTEDYYALAGVFASTQMFNRPLDGEREAGKDGQAKSPTDAMHIVREGKPTDLPVYLRGDVTSKGDVVPRRFLSALSTEEPRPLAHGSGRLDLADAIASPDNPLTSRVFVNRIWGEVFGRPIVTTPSNFGTLGDRPSHPRLLDDLASRFARSGFSLRALLREIVLSETYRRASVVPDDVARRDPDNRLLGRRSRRRLDVETWRDSILAVTGSLDSRVGGPSIDPADPEGRRRTLYSAVSRLDLNPMLALFDFPDPNAHAARRARTTTPLQKLFALNSPFMASMGAKLHARLGRDVPVDAKGGHVRGRIERAYRLLFARGPSDEELRMCEEFLDVEPEASGDAWTLWTQALLASNELLFVD